MGALLEILWLSALASCLFLFFEPCSRLYQSACQDHQVNPGACARKVRTRELVSEFMRTIIQHGMMISLAYGMLASYPFTTLMWDWRALVEVQICFLPGIHIYLIYRWAIDAFEDSARAGNDDAINYFLQNFHTFVDHKLKVLLMFTHS